MFSTLIAYILFFLSGFGVLGLHRLYLGKIPTAILWMFTGGFFLMGSFYDFFTLPSQVREANMQKAIFDESIRHKLNKRSGMGQNWRDVDDGESRIVNEKEPVEHVALKLAKNNKGIITTSELALAANISIDEAKKALDVMVSKGFAELRVRQSGALVYAIPDLMGSDDPLIG